VLAGELVLTVDQRVADLKACARRRRSWCLCSSSIRTASWGALELLAHTGLRVSEAVGLTWRLVRLGTRPEVLVREQLCEGERRRLNSHHARRELPLPPVMAERLRALRRDAYRGDSARVFASAAGTELIRSNVAGRALWPAAVAVGLTVEAPGGGGPVPWVSFHTFRHTCASLLFDADMTVKQVQE
jgi:integrase